MKFSHFCRRNLFKSVQIRSWVSSSDIGDLPVEVKRPGSEADHSPPSSVKVKNSSSSITLQSNTYPRLLKGLLPVSCFFYLSIQFVTSNLLVSVCTQFHRLFFGRPLSRFPFGLLLNTWLAFLLLSSLLTWTTQFNRLILTNERISKSPDSCMNSLLRRFLHFSFALLPQNVLFKTFLSKIASRLAISLFSVQEFAPILSLVLFMSYRSLFFLLWVPIGSLVEAEVHNMVYLHS